MSDENAVNARVSTRCSACRLPADVLDALHCDRFEGMMSFSALAIKHGQSRHLSEAGVRRHFNNGHIAEPGDSLIRSGEFPANGIDTNAASHDRTAGDGLD